MEQDEGTDRTPNRHSISEQAEEERTNMDSQFLGGPIFLKERDEVIYNEVGL